MNVEKPVEKVEFNTRKRLKGLTFPLFPLSFQHVENKSTRKK